MIIDEASALEPEIRDSIESLGYERLVAIGNPIRAEGPFVEWIRQAEADARDGIPDRLATNAIQIPSTDSPHATDREKPVGHCRQDVYREQLSCLWWRTFLLVQQPYSRPDPDGLGPAAYSRLVA